MYDKNYICILNIRRINSYVYVMVYFVGVWRALPSQLSCITLCERVIMREQTLGKKETARRSDTAHAREEIAWRGERYGAVRKKRTRQERGERYSAMKLFLII